MSHVSSDSFPSLDEFWEAIEVRDPLPFVPAEFSKPTHDLTWRNLAILNARRKPYAYKFPWATWLSLFPLANPEASDGLSTADDNQSVELGEEGGRFSSAKLYIVEKAVGIIGITRTESDRSHTSCVYGLISEDGEEEEEEEEGEEEEEEEEEELDVGIPTAFTAEPENSRRKRHICIIPETTPERPWGKVCMGCDGER